MTNDDFDDWTATVCEVIRDALISGQVADFAGLLRLMPGLPPEVACKALEALQRDDVMVAIASGLLESARSPVEPIDDPLDHVLPPPHPLDYEWRFNLETRRALSDQLLASAGASGHIVLLGCPTVAHELVSSASRPRLTLIDANPALPKLSDREGYLQIQADLRAWVPVGAGDGDVCLADPPFYPEYVRAFLVAASRLLLPGSLLMFVTPPPATRPNARSDVDEAVAFAALCGFVHLGASPGSVTYHRPPFERNAHAALGLFGVPDGWRVADVHKFERSTEPSTPPNGSSNDIQVWNEVLVGYTRVRVRMDQPGKTSPVDGSLLLEAVPGGILNSVSGRDPRRALANVWTDGNVVWFTHDPQLLITILRATEIGTNPVEAAVSHYNAVGVDPDYSLVASLVNDAIGKVAESS